MPLVAFVRTAAMKIGDLVTYQGRSYVLRGLEPMSVPNRRDELEDPERRENTFYAQITVQLDGSEIEVDSRPSDAIALAIRAEAPIFAADDVIEESAIEFEGDEVTEEEIESRVSEFKQFLDEVTPDEFAIEPEEE